MSNFQLELNELKTTEDYQHLVDAINALLCMDSEVEANVVTSAHQKLDQAIRQTNQRLKTCDGLLQKGLRPEALQQAQIDPSLLDVISILDFDELELWNNYAQQCGFSRVPELLVDVVDDLETAFADEEPLTDLRYRHRLHALARSPLPIRIDILRKLAQVDQSNPLWEEELIIYEKSRLADVLAECKAAAAAEDLQRITALEQELSSNDWRVAPSKKLVGFTTAKSQEIQGKFAREHLEDLEPQLNDAYSLSDVETARKLREEWGRHVAVAKLSEQDPLMQKVLEPLKWLAEKDRQDREQAAFHAAVKDLEQALDRKEATKADFEPLYYKIEQFGRGVPENLQQRLATRVEELDREASRKRMIKLASLATGTVVLLILIGVGIFLYARNVELIRHVTNLQGLIEEEQLDKAEVYVADLSESNPRVHEHQDFQAVIRILEQKVQEDEDRRNQLEYKLSVARNTLEELTADNPASLELSRLNQGYNALNDADAIAKTEMERTTISELGDELKKKEKDVQSLVDAKFESEVVQFHQNVKGLDPDVQGYSGQLVTHKANAESLKERKWISDDLGPRLVDPILTELDSLIKQDEVAREEAKYLADIRKAVGDPNSYRIKMNSYVNNEEFDGNPRQRDFQQVLKNETSLWIGAEEWNGIKSKLKGTNLVSYSPKFAPDRIAEANTLLQQHKGFPDEAALKNVVNFLNLLVFRHEGQLLAKLETNILNKRIVSNLYMLKTKAVGQNASKIYYSEKTPSTLGNTHYSIRYALDLFLEDVKTQTVKNEEIANPLLLKDGKKFDFESPQMKFSRVAIKKVNGLSSNPTTWERDFLELLIALQKDKEMDEVLKFMLYSNIEKVACAGSLYLQEQLKEDLEVWENFEQHLDTDANWIDPENGSDDKDHKTASAALAKLKEPSDVIKGVDAYLKSVSKVDLGPQYKWIGWLHRDRKNQWTVSFGSDQPLSQTAVKLNVLTRSGSSGPVNLTEIGELKNGQVTISVPDVSPALLQGRPVYKLQ